ncbi:MAG: oxidoreductase domain protein [Chloroflexi bacterium]|nr:oxidoreductase domain protein [Chloroflexota bacterium]MDB5076872.1 oxidoreductase domain protein [Chloroflexota bacterium]
MTDRVRVGIVGCGDIAFRRYLPGFATIEDQAVIAGFYDRDSARSAAAVAAYGASAYESMDALLADPTIDAVLNLTPPKHHVPVSSAVLDAGKHLLTEKLMANTLDEADLLIAQARRADRVFVCAPAVAISPFMVDLRRLLHGGAIGRVLGARAQLSTFGPAGWREYTSDPTWFYEEGAGPLADLGVYPLHMLTELLGPVRRVSAMASISLPTRTVLYGPAAGKEISVGVADNVQMLLDFTDGDAPKTIASLDSTYCAWATTGPHLEIYGTDGALVVNSIYDDTGTIRMWRAGGDGAWSTAPRISSDDLPTRGLYIFGGAAHLVECIQRGLPPLLTGEHARHVLDVILTAGRAARDGVTLDVQTSFDYPKDWEAFGQ